MHSAKNAGITVCHANPEPFAQSVQWVLHPKMVYARGDAIDLVFSANLMMRSKCARSA